MLLLNHFAEKFHPDSCKKTCDNCASTDKPEEINLSTHAVYYVRMMQELENRHLKITGPLSIHAFRATSKPEMAKRNFNTLEYFGKGSNISVGLAKRLLDHLLAREILTTVLEDAQGRDRAPISYIYVIALHLFFALLQLTRPNAARAQGEGVSCEANLHVDDSLRKGSRCPKVQEGCRVSNPWANGFDQEEATARRNTR